MLKFYGTNAINIISPRVNTMMGGILDSLHFPLASQISSSYNSSQFIISDLEHETGFETRGLQISNLALYQLSYPGSTASTGLNWNLIL